MKQILAICCLSAACLSATAQSINIKGLSGNLVGISINLCKSIQKELFINDTP